MLKNIFGVYKPKGPTSHDIIDKIRRITGVRKVGHAGTLDPLAEGVLVVAIGREGTKQINEFVKKEKEYVAKVKLGEESTTDDEEGEKTEMGKLINWQIDKAMIEKVVKKFIGVIEQVPPIYSAIKMKGRKAYDLARQGIEVKMEPRKVKIMEIEILEYTQPFLTIRVVTGPGVYIRSLARDIGRELGTGAYLAGLKRTRVGDFTAEAAIKDLEELKK